MKTAAIIVNHNNQDDLKKLVSRIKEYDIFDAVVIVDNKSDDIDSVEKIVYGDNGSKIDEIVHCDNSYQVGKIVLIKAEKNGGYGYGNNIGLKWAFDNGMTHAVIANPDTEFSEECVRAMLNSFVCISGDSTNDSNGTESNIKDSGVGVVAPICKTPESKYEAPKSGWNLKTWGQELLSKGPVCRRVFKNYINKNDPVENSAASSSVKVDAVLGSLLTVDVTKFNEVGGYDDDVFLYCEENILGQKMKSHGYATRLLIDQEYIHNHKPGKPSSQAMKKLTDSELYYFENYMHISDFQMLISKIFFAIVRLEVRIFAK